MFHRLRRRPKPATAIAGAALFVALSGTAVAQSDILITSADQLGPNVVTAPAVGGNAISSTNQVRNGSLSRIDLRNPQLQVRGLAFGGQLSESDGTSVRESAGTYFVTFNPNLLNPSGSTSGNLLNRNCAFTATSRNRQAFMSVDGPRSTTPNTVRVNATFPEPTGTGLLEGVDSQFDLIASC